MHRKRREDRSHVITIILAGGAGNRLFPLTKSRSKPAVPLGGKYRIIDIAISNSINSDLKKIFVLTQFNSASLNSHITNTFKFDPFTDGFVEVLAAEQTMTNVNWFQGTADAVRQHLHRFSSRDDNYHLVLSGDQLYRMDFEAMLHAHWESGADATVCVIPRDEAMASSFGLLKLNRDGRVVQFREKPRGEALHEMQTDTTAFGLTSEQATQRPYLASMGIYLFNHDALFSILADPSMIDFGHQVLPRTIQSFDVRGFLFDGYWEDLGTIEAFYRANIDLTSSAPHFDFNDMQSPIFTRSRFLPPSWIENCQLRDTMIADGSILRGAKVTNSIIGIRSVVNQDAVLERALLMGADYFEDERNIAYNREHHIPNIGVGRASVIRRSIIDKNARIGENVRIVNEGDVRETDGSGFYVRDGIVIIPQGVVIPDGTVI